MAARKHKLVDYDLQHVYGRLYARRGADALDRVAAFFALSKTEIGRLFGVSRQAIDEWRVKGVPPARMADVARVADLATAMHTRFLPERLPQIVREQLPGLGGRTILRAIREVGTADVFAMLERAFSYIPAA